MRSFGAPFGSIWVHRPRRSANSLPWREAAAALEGSELLRSHWQSPWEVCVAQMGKQPDVLAVLTACAAAAQWQMALQILEQTALQEADKPLGCFSQVLSGPSEVHVQCSDERVWQG